MSSRLGYFKQRVIGKGKKYAPDSVKISREKMAAQKAFRTSNPAFSAKIRQPLKGIQNQEPRPPPAEPYKARERSRAVINDIRLRDTEMRDDSSTDYAELPSENDDDDDDEVMILPAVTAPYHHERPLLHQKVPSKTNRRASLNDYTLLVSDTEAIMQAKKARRAGFDVQAPRTMVLMDEPIDISGIGVGIQTMLRRQSDIEDIDSQITDPFMCQEYYQDIILYLKSREEMHTMSPDYLDTSGDITPKMRTILMDWLIQVQMHLNLLGDTLHMAVSIIDRFLTVADISLSRFQLLGITSLFVAAKYNERFAPEVDNLVHLTDNTYTYDHVIQMELVLLHHLKFDLSIPGPYLFLNRYLLAARTSDKKVQDLALFIIDLSVTDAQCIPFPKSEIAASALYLSMSVLRQTTRGVWTPTLAFYSMYSERDIYPCIRKLAVLLEEIHRSSYTAARSKYSSTSAYGAISVSPILTSNVVLEKLVNEEMALRNTT
ncbi:G2/mitotic-specific cyclin-B-like [Tubulanus polymorphus]|uniref:G2/mitotic-specific cyclin-B-like n=1 Tax=Tubulanus polymorphus TaxID=672921 RepID=UPI003DA686AA